MYEVSAAQILKTGLLSLKTKILFAYGASYLQQKLVSKSIPLNSDKTKL